MPCAYIQIGAIKYYHGYSGLVVKKDITPGGSSANFILKIKPGGVAIPPTPRRMIIFSGLGGREFAGYAPNPNVSRNGQILSLSFSCVDFATAYCKRQPLCAYPQDAKSLPDHMDLLIAKAGVYNPDEDQNFLGYAIDTVEILPDFIFSDFIENATLDQQLNALCNQIGYRWYVDEGTWDDPADIPANVATIHLIPIGESSGDVPVSINLTEDGMCPPENQIKVRTFHKDPPEASRVLIQGANVSDPYNAPQHILTITQTEFGPKSTEKILNALLTTTTHIGKVQAELLDPYQNYDFSLTCGPGGTRLEDETESVKIPIVIEKAFGFTGSITLEAVGPSGLTISLSTPAPSGYFIRYLATVTPTNGTWNNITTEKGKITFTATSGTLVKEAYANIDVLGTGTPSFDIIVTPVSQTVDDGTSTAIAFNVEAAASYGFEGDVDLTISAPLAGVTFVFTDTTIPAGTSTILTCTPTDGTWTDGDTDEEGTFTVQGESGAITRTDDGEIVIQAGCGAYASFVIDADCSGVPSDCCDLPRDYAPFFESPLSIPWTVDYLDSCEPPNVIGSDSGTMTVSRDSDCSVILADHEFTDPDMVTQSVWAQGDCDCVIP